MMADPSALAPTSNERRLNCVIMTFPSRFVDFVDGDHRKRAGATGIVDARHGDDVPAIASAAKPWRGVIMRGPVCKYGPSGRIASPSRRCDIEQAQLHALLAVPMIDGERSGGMHRAPAIVQERRP